MFYTALVNYLRSIPEIVATVETYNSVPCIFSNEAPEGAKKPYIIIGIHNSPINDHVIMTSDTSIDYYDYDVSRVKADVAGEEIEKALDQMKLESDRLIKIRFSLNSAGHVPDVDPRTVHYNLLFRSRAVRCKWIRETQ